MPKSITEKARALRSHMTEAEQRLWHRLRGKQLGIAFRRQYPIGPYITDFACSSLALVIELDGGQHADAKDYDARRDAYLQAKGYKVLRFWNNDVMEETESVLGVIWREVEMARERHSPSQPPPPAAEEQDSLPACGEG